MINEVKTFEERKLALVKLGKEKGSITYEQLADELKGLDVDADSLDDLYNVLLENNIEIKSDEIEISSNEEEDYDSNDSYDEEYELEDEFNDNELDNIDSEDFENESFNNEEGGEF